MHAQDLALIPKQYQNMTLQKYLDELFEWYEKFEPKVVAGVGAPTTDIHSSTFEHSLAKYGLGLNDLTFNEIIQDDVVTILQRRGIKPINNSTYYGLGGVV